MCVGVLMTVAVVDRYTTDRQLEQWMERDWVSLAKMQLGLGLRDVKGWLQRVRFTFFLLYSSRFSN